MRRGKDPMSKLRTTLALLTVFLMPIDALGLGSASSQVIQEQKDGSNDIAYLSADEAADEWSVAIVDPDTGRSRMIVPPKYQPWAPAWSPDKTKIAFLSMRDRHLYVVDAHGARIRRLTTYKTDPSGVYGRSVAWSPDGRTLLYSHGSASECVCPTYTSLRTVSLDGSARKELTERGNNLYGAQWSPDGKRIAYINEKRGWGDARLFVMNANGTDKRQITHGLGSVSGFDWAPKGDRILFTYRVYRPEPNDELFVINSDGTRMTRLTRSNLDEWDPSWSPDGKKVAFVRAVLEHYEVFTAEPDGTDEKQLTRTQTLSYPDYAWSPEGDRIVYVVTKAVPVPPTGLGKWISSLFIIESDGHVPRPASLDTRAFLPDW